MVDVQSYQRAVQQIGTRPYTGGRIGRQKVDRNTYLERRDVNTIALKLHDTDIVTYHEDGTVVLDTGGWKTVTTRDRMRAALPKGFSLVQTKGQWYLMKTDQPWQEPDAPRWLFVDGMMIKGGEVYGGIRADKEVIKARLKERRKAKQFARDYIDALRSGDVPAPSGGDCWLCAFKDEKGHHVLESDAADHMREHMKENYFVPTILADAVKRFPVSMMAHDVMAVHWGAGTEEQRKMVLDMAKTSKWEYNQLEKSLYRYIIEKLGQAT